MRLWEPLRCFVWDWLPGLYREREHIPYTAGTAIGLIVTVAIVIGASVAWRVALAGDIERLSRQITAASRDFKCFVLDDRIESLELEILQLNRRISASPSGRQREGDEEKLLGLERKLTRAREQFRSWECPDRFE